MIYSFPDAADALSERERGFRCYFVDFCCIYLICV